MKKIFTTKKSLWALINAAVFVVLVGVWYVRGANLPAERAPQASPDALDALALNAPISSTTSSAAGVIATVSRVIDGDTIELETGERVRYIGVDTPETVDPRKKVQCFGKEASTYNQTLVEGKQVRLEKDVSDRDRYHRLLRYVYLLDGTFVNHQLLTEGYARAATFPPDVKYSKLFATVAGEAREAGKGLWRKCK